MKKNIYNALVFNVAWLACIFGGSAVAVIVAIVVVGIHLTFISEQKIEAVLIGSVVLLGIVVESLFIRSGLLLPPDSSLWPPLWLISLWSMFATLLNHSLKWFQTHLGFAAVLGGLSSAMTYLAGTRLTDFSLGEPQLVSLVAIFLAWCAVFPVCLVLAKKLLNPARPAA